MRGRGAAREAWGRWVAATQRRARGGPDSRLGGQGTRGAHVEHVAHGCDAGGVETQRLVERRRALPRVETRAYVCGEVCESAGGRGGGRRRCKQHAGQGSTADTGRHGEERTSNMANMVVTLEVSKLSGWLNADAYCRGSKGGHIRCGVRYMRGRQAGGGGRPRRTQRGERARIQI